LISIGRTDHVNEIPEKVPHPLKMDSENVLTQLQINWFRSYFVQCLNTWYPKCCKCSRSRGQRSGHSMT